VVPPDWAAILPKLEIKMARASHRTGLRESKTGAVAYRDWLAMSIQRRIAASWLPSPVISICCAR
jgi:hypothetical protein